MSFPLFQFSIDNTNTLIRHIYYYYIHTDSTHKHHPITHTPYTHTHPTNTRTHTHTYPRLTLNQHILEECLKSILKETRLVTLFYSEHAILSNIENVQELVRDSI
jgi:RUN domain